MPFVTRITLYPVKSFDGVEVTEASVLASGALAGDREFAITDPQGSFVNGKRNAKIHLLRSRFDLQRRSVTLQVQGEAEQHSFSLDGERQPLETWLGGYFGFPVALQHNPLAGFPDDTEASGPTIIGAVTLKEVSSWFPGIQAEDAHRRFRANLEIGDAPAFWEDRLFSEPGAVVEFEVGAVRITGINPCQRCAVPTRDPLTGEAHPGFQKTFAARREATLPSWAASSRFTHFYRLAVNTRISRSEAGKMIRVGDEVRVIGINQAAT